MTSLEKILVVEDEPDLAMMLETGLTAIAGFVVKSETDPLSAVESALEFCPDLILLDWMMPLKNGKSVLIDLKGHHELARTPVIFITASMNRAELNELASISSGVIGKPFELPEVIAKIKEFSA